MNGPGGPSGGPSLFVSDIDGTLVTTDKRLTPAAIEAVAELKAAGVPFTVVSSRPPRGMRRIVDALGLQLPFAAFNGANLVDPVNGVIAAHRLSARVARTALQLIAARKRRAMGVRRRRLVHHRCAWSERRA